MSLTQTELYEIQWKGPFATSWLANNTKYLKKFCEKYDINGFNITDICNKITSKLTCTLSRNERKRQQIIIRNSFHYDGNDNQFISFQIISRLYFGTVYIFQKQVDHLLELTTNLMKISQIELLKTSNPKTFTARKRIIKNKKKHTNIFKTTGNYVQTISNEISTNLLLDTGIYKTYYEEYRSADDSSPTNTKSYCPQVTCIREITMREINIDCVQKDDDDMDDENFGSVTDKEVAQFFCCFQENESLPCLTTRKETKNRSKRKIKALKEDNAISVKHMRLSDDKFAVYNNQCTVDMENEQYNRNANCHLLNENCHIKNEENSQKQMPSIISRKQNLSNNILIKEEGDVGFQEPDQQIQNDDNEMFNITHNTKKHQTCTKLIVDHYTTITKEEINKNIENFNKNWSTHSKVLRKQFRKKLSQKKVILSGIQLLKKFNNNRRNVNTVLHFHKPMIVDQNKHQDNFFMLIREIFPTDNTEQYAEQIYPKWLNCYNDKQQRRIRCTHIPQLLGGENTNNEHNVIHLGNGRLSNHCTKLNKHTHREYQPFGVMMKLLNLWQQLGCDGINANVFCNNSPSRLERALTFSSILVLVKMKIIVLTKVESTACIDQILMGKELKSLMWNYLQLSNY